MRSILAKRNTCLGPLADNILKVPSAASSPKVVRSAPCGDREEGRVLVQEAGEEEY